MKVLLFVLFSILTVQLPGQIIEITPRTKYGNYFSWLSSDNNGNVYTICSGGPRVDIMKYSKGQWTFLAVPEKGAEATGVFPTENRLFSSWKKDAKKYVVEYAGSNTDLYPFSYKGELLHVDSRANSIMLFGKFISPAGELCNIVDRSGGWKPRDINQASTELRQLLSTAYLHNVTTDSKGNIFVIATSGNPAQDHILMYKDSQWKTIRKDTSTRYIALHLSYSGELYATAYDVKNNTKAKVLRYTGNNLAWLDITPALPKFSDKLMNAITSNDAAEVIVAGQNQDASGNYILLKWNGKIWNEFASIKEGPIKHMTFTKGEIIAVTGDGTRIFRIPAGSKPTTTTTTSPIVTSPKDPKAKEIWDIYLKFVKDVNADETKLNTALKNVEGSKSTDEAIASLRLARSSANTLWTTGLVTRSAIRKQVAFRENWFADFITSTTDALQEYMSAFSRWCDSLLEKKSEREIEVTRKTMNRTESVYHQRVKEMHDAKNNYMKRNGF